MIQVGLPRAADKWLTAESTEITTSKQAIKAAVSAMECMVPGYTDTPDSAKIAD